MGAVSEIDPLRTEALVTNVSEGVDDLAAVPRPRPPRRWRWTSAASPWPQDLVLYLFGTPGQRRFWFMWDDLCRGAIGAIVLVDTRRLDERFAAGLLRGQGQLPFVVAVNQFDGAQQLRRRGDPRGPGHLPRDVPIITVDARDRESAKQALVRVTEFSLMQLAAAAQQGVPQPAHR